MGGLEGTLSGQGVLDQMEVERQRRAAELDAQVRAAAQASQQAGNAYQQAAAAPAPDVGAMQQFAPLLLASIASVLQGSEAPKERAHADIQRQRNELLRRRSENLQALHDIFDQRAKRAESLGDAAGAEQFRSKMETLSKQHETVLKQLGETAATERTKLQQSGQTERERMGNQTALEVARINAGARGAGGVGGGAGSNYDELVLTSPNGTRVLDVSQLTGKDKQAAMQWARDNKIIAEGKEGTGKIRDLSQAYENIGLMREAIGGLLPESGVDRLLGKGPRNVAEAATQIGGNASALNSFGVFRLAAIQHIKALAGGTGSGLRLNQAEINLAVQNDIPRITDTLPVARAKLARLEAMLNRAEHTYTSKNLKVGTAARSTSPAAAPADEPADFEWVPGKGLVPAGGK